MKKQKAEKTNVMRIIEQHKLPYESHDYSHSGAISGMEVVEALGLPLTGYIHGGCSPIGMKKQFRTTIHQTARDYPTVFFSGGKIGHQIEMAPDDLQKIVPIEYADII